MSAAVREIELDYEPRDIQRELHEAFFGERATKHALCVWHRRAGKSVAFVNHLIRGALTCSLRAPRFGYIAPLYRQAKAIAWDYLRYYSRPIPGVRMYESDLRVDYPNGGRVQLFGADNPDSLRGLYFDGVVLDEFGQIHPDLRREVLIPALADRGGWEIVGGTPQGQNQFYDLYETAKEDPAWFVSLRRASETGILSPETLHGARKEMSPELYAQEFECSWSAAIKGSFYGSRIEDAERDARVAKVPYEPQLRVTTAWDLGIGDSTAIWFAQQSGREVRLIDYYEAEGESLAHYAKVLQERGYVYGDHIAPHDIEVRELGTGKSRLEVAAALGIRFRVAPLLAVEDGIEAVRNLLPRCWFDAEKCRGGLDALKGYRREYHERRETFSERPLHDWASHACVVAGSLVDTERGALPIEQVRVGDRAWTPRGYSTVTHAGPVKRAATLVEIILDDSRKLTCTPEHKLLTKRGFVPADELRYSDCLFNGTEWSCVLSSWFSKVGSIGFRAATTAPRTGARVRATFIVRCGSFIAEQFRRAMTSTIEMKTAAIATSTTWSASSPQSISGSTHDSGIPGETSFLRAQKLFAWPRSGIAATRGARGTASTRVPSGRIGSGMAAFARSAAGVFARLTLRAPSSAISIARWRRYDVGEDAPLVYDLTVDAHACYRANGVLVSNSDAFRYLAVGLRETPRVKGETKPPSFRWVA